MSQTLRRPDVWFHLAIGGLSAAILLAAVVLQIEHRESVRLAGLPPFPELCWLRRNCGLPCPGCGMTRSFISLAHGDLAAACDFNLAGPLLFVLAAVQIPYRGWQVWRIRTGRTEFCWKYWQWVPILTVLVVMVGQWVWKMVVRGSEFLASG